MPEPEQPLTGGSQTPGVVRVGDTVRRPAHSRSAQTQALLRHLERVGFTGAPRALGFDAQGREVLGWVDGEVGGRPPYDLADGCLVAAARLLLDYHDAAASSSWCGEQETVCHGDLGPHNTVFRDGLPVAFLDWDHNVRPGQRAVDFADAVWGFADLTQPTVPLPEQARRVALMCSAYPGMTPGVVVEELLAQFHRARDNHVAAGRERAVAVMDRLVTWTERHRDELGRYRPTGAPCRG